MKEDGTIRNAGGLCLNVSGGAIAQVGANVQASQCNDSEAQRWSYDRTSRQLRTTAGLCLDVDGARTADGTNVQIVTCRKRNVAQQWQPDYRGVRGQAAQLENFAREVIARGETIDTILLSIGGNDIGFADIIQDCASRSLDPVKSDLNASCSNADGRTVWVKVGTGSYARLVLKTLEKSTLSQKMDDQLYPVSRAVFSGLTNIVEALDRAGVDRASYKIIVQSYPIGVPPSGDTAQYLRWTARTPASRKQNNCGTPFTPADLDYFNQVLGPTIRGRVIEGAKLALDKMSDPNLDITVLDATSAFDRHRLCSNAVPVPEITKKMGDQNGNSLTPPWTGATGGAAGQWITPILLNCFQASSPFCDKDEVPSKAYSNLWQAVSSNHWDVDLNQVCQPTNYSHNDIPGFIDRQGMCGIMLENANQLPMHPNYWGQRMLAACHEAIANDPNSAGQVIKCSATQDRDPYGRPKVAIEREWDIDAVAIQSALGGCLDVSYNGDIGANVQFWQCNDTRPQKWVLNGNQIRNTIGNCLAVKAVGQAPANVVVASCSDVPEQRWHYNQDQQQLYTEANSNFCLDVASAATANGTNVQVVGCTANNNAQRWLPLQTYGTNIKSKTGGRCLDVASGLDQDLTNVQIWSCNGSPAQAWRIVGDEIRTVWGRCLDVNQGTDGSGTNVQIYACNGTDAQRWKIEGDQIRHLMKDAQGNDVLGLCLDVSFGEDRDGANVQLYNCNGTKAQDWETAQD